MRSKTKLKRYMEKHHITLHQLHNLTGMHEAFLRDAVNKGVTTKALATKIADGLMEKNIMLFFDGKDSKTNCWSSD